MQLQGQFLRLAAVMTRPPQKYGVPFVSKLLLGTSKNSRMTLTKRRMTLARRRMTLANVA